MIDIHAHILPGIDDGAKDIYESLEMAACAARNGTTAIVATPHCNFPGVYDNYFGQSYIDAYERTVEAVRNEGIPIEIYPGMEVFATYDLPDLLIEKKIMPLNQSRYVLIEFAFGEDPAYISKVLQLVKKVGARPVIAHAERYKCVQENPQIAYKWRKRGYLIQANKSSFQGKFGNAERETVLQLLSHNLVNVIASDAHSKDIRTTNMSDVYGELCAICTPKELDVLFTQNPGRICRNENILSRKAIPFE